MHTASIAFRFGLAELRWSLTGLWGHVRWFHRFWFVVAMFTWLAADVLDSWKPFAVVGAIALSFALWARFQPHTYYRAISHPLTRRSVWLDLLESWPLLMEECGLEIGRASCRERVWVAVGGAAVNETMSCTADA